ncbi:MAG TPA: hypothetical protein VFS21_28875 [Roseiflexaceae bacterium]|nr:hypothetical protein [Roseiflexaceae bacterium]
MSHLHTPSVPDELYSRGMELGLLPRAQDLQSDKTLMWLGRGGPLLYRHAGALLATGELTGGQRTTLEDAGLAYARYASSHPLQGAQAYARIVPLLPPERRAAVRAEARAALDQAGSFLARTRPEGSSRMQLYRDCCTLLLFRELWQMLAPEEYPVWLRQQSERLLRPSLWWAPPQLYRENLAHIHLLGDDAPRALVLALDGVLQVSDPSVDTDVEWGMGGAFVYSAADVEKAAREAGGVALGLLAPILPPELHPRAVDLAAVLGIAPPADLGAQQADPLAARGLAWYHTVPDPLASGGPAWYQSAPALPAPWLTVTERAAAFAVLDSAVRSAQVAALVAAVPPLAEAFDTAKGNPKIIERWTRLTREDLPVAAPYLDEGQTRSLLALWGLPADGGM